MWSWYPCRITTGCGVWKFFTHITLTLVGMRAQGARLIDAFCLLSAVVSFNYLFAPLRRLFSAPDAAVCAVAVRSEEEVKRRFTNLGCDNLGRGKCQPSARGRATYPFRCKLKI